MGRTFACSDLHGMYSLYIQINDFLKSDDIVYFLGDAVDRGPKPWQLFKAIMNNSQWIYLKGNHEDMLAEAIIEYFETDGRPDYYCQNLMSNGGAQTLSNWIMDGEYYQWAKVINKLQHQEKYINKNKQTILLSHAGFTPSPNGKTVLLAREILWSRKHFFDAWPENEKLKNVFIIHGHTPVPYLLKDFNKTVPEYKDLCCCWYCEKDNIYHKCDLDLGAWASNKTCLLDLDTFEEYYFSV